MEISKIHPVNDYNLVQLEDKNAGRIIHLGSDRRLSSARYGKYLAGRHALRGDRVLCAHGGFPVGDSSDLVLVPRAGLISIEGQIQEPYIHICPEEVRTDSPIWLIEETFSGWYKVLDSWPGSEVEPGSIILPLYETPRLEMEDDTEYIRQEGIGVVQCMER